MREVARANDPDTLPLKAPPEFPHKITVWLRAVGATDRYVYRTLTLLPRLQ